MQSSWSLTGQPKMLHPYNTDPEPRLADMLLRAQQRSQEGLISNGRLRKQGSTGPRQELLQLWRPQSGNRSQRRPQEN